MIDTNIINNDGLLFPITKDHLLSLDRDFLLFVVQRDFKYGLMVHY